jgi:hypothetical protein
MVRVRTHVRHARSPQLVDAEPGDNLIRVRQGRHEGARGRDAQPDERRCGGAEGTTRDEKVVDDRVHPAIVHGVVHMPAAGESAPACTRTRTDRCHSILSAPVKMDIITREPGWEAGT